MNTSKHMSVSLSLLTMVLMAFPALANEKEMALTGFDPVSLIVDGTQVKGKAEYLSSDDHFQYQFVSTENMEKFNSDKARFGVQNEMCPVAPDLPAEPSLFTVHEGKIYIFATGMCIDQFESSPEGFLQGI